MRPRVVSQSVGTAGLPHRNGDIKSHANDGQHTQADTDDEYKALLEEAGLYQVLFYSNMPGESVGRAEYFPITGLKPG